MLSVPGDYGLSAAYAVFFMALMALMAIFYARLIRSSERYAVIRGRGFNPSRYRLGSGALSRSAIWRLISY